MNGDAQDLDQKDGGLSVNLPSEKTLPKFEWPLIDDATTAMLQQMAADGSWAVSYTHLTLPTIYSV